MTIGRYVAGEAHNKVYEAVMSMTQYRKPGISFADMIRLRMSGAVSGECRDVYYAAHEDGKGFSRLWMGWGKHPDAIGNWGNFYTDESCRGQGLGKQMLDFWYQDLEKEKNPPLAFFCTAATERLTRVYARYGFVTALRGASCGQLYKPMGDSPETFQAFCERYYTPADLLLRRPARVEWRHEIDCLLKFALLDCGEAFGIGDVESLEAALLYCPERAALLFTPQGRCAGWQIDDTMQVYPCYRGLSVEEAR